SETARSRTWLETARPSDQSDVAERARWCSAMTMHTTETRTKNERVVTLPFTPNTAQDEFIHSGAPKTMIVASVAAGKTTALCMRAWMISWKYPGNKGMMARYTYDEIRDTIIPTWKKCVPKELMINPDCLDRK